jgi:hypothetical protein
MNLFSHLKPKTAISRQDITAELSWITREEMVSLGFNSITIGGFLALNTINVYGETHEVCYRAP